MRHIILLIAYFCIVLEDLVLASSIDFIEPPFMHGTFIYYLGNFIGYFIQDLMPSIIQDFNLVSGYWTVKFSNNTAISSPVIACSNTFYLGGLIMSPGSSLARTYSSLIAHQVVIYNIKIVHDINWNPGAKLFFEIDGSTPIEFDPSSYPSGLDRKDCGSDITSHYSLFLTGKISHTNNSISLKLGSTITSPAPGWFAIRRVQLLLRSDTSVNLTQGCILGSQLQSPQTGICGCQLDTTDPSDASGGCNNCHPTCKNCFGPSASECITCQSGYSYNGLECVKTCPLNCVLCNPQTNECSSCLTGKFLYWNYTCNLACGLPFKTKPLGTSKLCQTPCQPDKFMLWNNTCNATCEFPLTSIMEGEAKFCKYPCQSAEYLYWNGSCLPSCEVNPRIEGQKMFCDACYSGYYLYSNNQCLKDCPLPLVARTEGKYNFCDFPCRNNSLPYYNTEENACKSYCDYPFSLTETLLCVLGLSEEEAKQVQTLADVTSFAEQTLLAGATVMGMVSFNDPQSFSLVTLTKMLQYIKYIRVSYSPRLKRSLNLQNSESGLSKWAPKIPQGLKEKFAYHSIPDNFEQYHLHSSFFVNFWKPALTLSFIFVLTLFAILLVKCSSNLKAINSICKKAEQVLKWNFSLMLFTTFYDDIAIFTSLDLQSSKLNSSWPILSLGILLLINILSIFILIKGIFLIGSIQNHKNSSPSRRLRKSQQLKDYTEKWKDYQVLFEICKDNSFFTQGFIPFFIIRVYLFGLVLAYLYDYPLAQAIIITSLSVIFILYLLIFTPFKEKLKLFQYITQEGIILIVNISVLILAIHDSSEIENYRLRQTTSDIILYSNTSFVMLGSIFLIVQNFVKVWKFFKTKRTAKSDKITQAKLPSRPTGLDQEIAISPVEQMKTPRPNNQRLKIKNFIRNSKNRHNSDKIKRETNLELK